MNSWVGLEQGRVCEREREQVRLGGNGWGAGRTQGTLNIRLSDLGFILM